MNNRIIFLGLIIGLFSASNVSGQTRFKDYVLIHVFEKPVPDSLKGLVKQSQFSTLYRYDIKMLAERKKTEYLTLKKGQQHITETQKTSKGVTHIIKTDSIVTADTTINITTSENYSSYPYIKPGVYRANLHPSNDTLYINFWLDDMKG